MTELLGKIPKSISSMGDRSSEYFNRKGELRKIKEFEFWSLERVLLEKYTMDYNDATSLASFLTPMLNYHQSLRATASECLRNPWISDDTFVNKNTSLELNNSLRNAEKKPTGDQNIGKECLLNDSSFNFDSMKSEITDIQNNMNKKLVRKRSFSDPCQ